MLKLIYIIYFIALGASLQAQTSKPAAYQAVFEGVCLGGGLDKHNIAPLMEMMAGALNGSIIPIPQKELALTSPYAKQGWLLRAGAEAFMVTSGERTEGGFTSASCTIAIKTGSPSEVIAFVEKKFRTKKLIDEVQGLSRILMFSADLIGMSGKHAIAIQSGNEMVTLSLFQTP